MQGVPRRVRRAADSDQAVECCTTLHTRRRGGFPLACDANPEGRASGQAPQRTAGAGQSRSLLKIPFGQGTGFPTKTSADDSRLFEQSVRRCCDLSTLQWFGAPWHPRKAIADRDDTRTAKAVQVSVSATGSGRSTLVATVQGDEFELQRKATTNPEREQGTEGGQKREHADDGMTVAPETLHFLGSCSFEQGQPPSYSRLDSACTNFSISSIISRVRRA